jgi:microsomal dipeptidase-like Zn-dependent dipeptidase
MRWVHSGIIRIVVLTSIGIGFGSTVCAQNWGPLEKDNCKAEGYRQMSSRLFNVVQGADSAETCKKTGRNVMGGRRVPDRCRQKKLLGLITLEWRGQWDVSDSTCLTVPPPVPVRGGTGSLASTAPLEGFADIHVHQMADLGFGGSIVWGGAFGTPSTVLGPIPSQYKYGHDTTETAVTSQYVKTIVNYLFGDVFGHGESGWPAFSSWPSHDIWTHQQVYEDWLYREYQGGLRLMVMLAVNSEDMFGRGENHLPGLFQKHEFQRYKKEGRTGNDMEALEWQVRASYMMQDAVDREHGGPGKGWYRIVRDPEEASEVVSEGKLAVILGTELQHLFNCDVDRPACSPAKIDDGLDQLEAMGVNYVFLIHHKLNQFGGPATFVPLNSGPVEKCADLTYECSSVGLTQLGRVLIEDLTERGMLIDTEHMSRKAFDDAMAIVEARKYPVFAGHAVPLDLQSETSQQKERARTSEELSRIFGVGGMVAPILGTSAGEYMPSNAKAVPIRCSSDDGGADQWANAYLLIRDLGKGVGGGGQIPIPFGADWNGFAGWPGPRYGKNHPCGPRYVKGHVPIRIEPRVEYPIQLPEELKLAAIGGTRTLDEFTWPKGGRDWDYNLVGAANAGMVPDFIENLRLLGLTVADLEPFYRSARGVVDVWQDARTIGATNGLHHLRWIPEYPFDVLPFDPSYRDQSRNVEGHEGYPLCRTRVKHELGFERDSVCQTVEETTSRASTILEPVPISAYHAGRCLDVKKSSFADDAKVVQENCGTWNSQLWEVRASGSGSFEILNVNSGKCLGIDEGSAVQQTCAGGGSQRFQLERVGNTFRIIPSLSTFCLEITNQSRADGAAVREAPCTTASNQLWTIDSLRSGDFETLYQADKHRVNWQASESAEYPIVVKVDETRSICRSRDSEHWIGVVTEGGCVGKTYAGASVTTSDFEHLYQAR